MNRCALLYRLAFGAVFTLALISGCSDSDAPTDPIVPRDTPPTEAVNDLHATGGAAGAVTLAWTIPTLLKKSAVEVLYDLRYVPLGDQDADWEDWTGANVAATDTAYGSEREYEVDGLEANATYAFRLASGTDGEVWSQPSNLVVATANGSLDTTPPAAIASLELSNWTETSATVSWAAAGDDSIYGTAFDYRIALSREEITLENWDTSYVDSLEWEPTDEPGRLQVSISNLNRFTDYHVVVRALDDALLMSGPCPPLTFETLVTDTVYVNVEGTGDFPTLNEAILASGPTDLILVGPGNYTWTGQGTGHPQYGLVHVPRGFTDFEIRSTEGAAHTVIDAQQQGNALYIMGGVNLDSHGVLIKDAITVDGFTLTGGLANGQVGVPGEAYAGGGLVFHLSDATIRNCIITGNEATQGGGIWYGGVGHPTFENCIIENNRSPSGAGILIINSSDRITLKDCTIRNNICSGSGGGIGAQNVVFTIENCTITGNRAAVRGGGIYVGSANNGSQVERSTIADNICGEGAGLYLQNSVIDLHTTIIASNSGPWLTDQLNSGVVMSCCDIIDQTNDEYRPGIFEDGGGNFSADPLFAGVGDYTLQPESPCLPGAHPDESECGRIGAEIQP